MPPHTPLAVAFDRPWPTTRRGLKLWLFAIIIGIKGLGYLRGQISPSTDSALRLVTRLHVPLEVCGGLIIATCTFAVVCSYCHHGRDRYGYMALTGFSWSWAGCFAAGALFLDAPSYAWQGALSYFLIGLFVLVSAYDDEEPHRDGSP